MLDRYRGRRHRCGHRVDRAYQLAREAAERLPADPSALPTGCEMLLARRDANP
jgi:hypothetical protein